MEVNEFPYVSSPSHVISRLKPYEALATLLHVSANVTLIVSLCTGHAWTPSFTVNVGHSVSTTIVQASLFSVIVFKALSLAHDTLKFNVPFVLHEKSIVQSRIVGVASLNPLVWLPSDMADTDRSHPSTNTTVGGCDIKIHAKASVKYTVTFTVSDHGLGVDTIEETVGAVVSQVSSMVS